MSRFLEISKEQTETFIQVVNQTADLMLITDVAGVIQYVNPAFERMTGYSASEVIGKLPRILRSGAHDESFYRNLWQVILAKQPYQGVICNRRKDGSLFYEAKTITPLLDENGQISGFVSTGKDITHLQEAEKRMRQQNEYLDAFAHMVAHDLKNPISIILGFSDLLLLDWPNLTGDRVQAALESIATMSRKLNSIVDEMLLLATFGKQETIPILPFRMTAILEDVQKRQKFLLRETNGEIILPGEWLPAWGYGPWIEEIWANFISNGLKYGGPSPKLVLGCDAPGNGYVRFWVRDQGPGLTPQKLEALFHQPIPPSATRAQGNGLGLAIVKRIADRLGSEVGVESQPGAGCLFYFTLPAFDE